MMKHNIQKAAVIGYPISHSLSPVIHSHWIKQYGLNASYEAIAVKPEELEGFIRSLPKNGFVGVNITLPYKEAVSRLLNEKDAVADRVGAVNTVVAQEGGLKGYNTDVYGFMENIRSAIPQDTGRKALILGAGGAARAVCAGLGEAGYSILLVNRTREKAEILVSQMQGTAIKVIDWAAVAKHLPTISLLVNTTSLGMKGQERLEIALDTLPPSALVTDIVYNPLETELLHQAQLRGNPAIDGLGMLLYQAQQAFYLWFGVLPDVNGELRQLVLRHRQV